MFAISALSSSRNSTSYDVAPATEPQVSSRFFCTVLVVLGESEVGAAGPAAKALPVPAIPRPAAVTATAAPQASTRVLRRLLVTITLLVVRGRGEVRDCPECRHRADHLE